MKPGRELDSLIAEKVMGLGPGWAKSGDNEVSNAKLPLYSTDMAAAWEVAEKLKLSVIKATVGWWSGEISSPVFAPDDVVDERLHGVTASTAPFAICMAALEKMGVSLN